MERVEESLKKHTTILQICLVFIAACFLSIGIGRPLADYDEATYAKVVVDTLKNGDVLSFTLSGNPWHEKPPLYLWFTMGSVKLLGEHEFAFRIPSILASILCLWLTYLIAKELTNSELTGLTAFSVLLTSSLFIYYAREMRLDSSVLATILAALWCWIKAWKNEKNLFWVLPLVAIGFLCKSVIALLVGLVLVVYSTFYQKWEWLKSKYLWYGLPLALIIFIPWHVIQIDRFGDVFLNRYFGYDVYKRATTAVMGGGKYYDYIKDMWLDGAWLSALISIIISFFSLIIFGKKFKSSIVWRPIMAPLVTFLSIITLFSLAKTHLTPYIMPVYPFVAVFVALFAYYVVEKYDKKVLYYYLIVLPLLLTGFIYCMIHISPTTAYVSDETQIGKIYAKKNAISVPMYALEWQILETLNYYGGTKVQFLGTTNVSGKELQGPFYLVVPGNGLSLFYTIQNGVLVSPYNNVQLLYKGQVISLVYFDGNMDFPVFNYQR